MDLTLVFSDPPLTASLTTKSVINGRASILFVSHDSDDGMWQFLPSFEIDDDEVRMVSLESILRLDRTLQNLNNLPLGWVAVRESASDEWQRSENEVNDDEDED